MRKINLKQNQKKPMIILTSIGVAVTCLLLASPLYLPDDTPVKDTWRTSLYSSMGFNIRVSDVTTSKETGETFFTLVRDGKPFNEENIKLSLHAINEDGTLTAIQNVSQLTLSAADKDNLEMTGYSFFWPATYHLQVTITSLDSDNHLLNQQVIYLDQRKANVNEEAFSMEYYVAQQLQNYQAPTQPQTTNKVENPTATKDDVTSEEVTGEDIQTPNDELQSPTGSLQQSYVIEEDEQVQSDHSDEIIETEEPVYTLADLEHQLSQAQDELTSNPDDDEIKQKISELEIKIQDMRVSEGESHE